MVTGGTMTSVSVYTYDAWGKILTMQMDVSMMGMPMGSQIQTYTYNASDCPARIDTTMSGAPYGYTLMIY
jgi:hypothetical protein